jgi:hypothetical protein
LWIFEVGSWVEGTHVAISTDGINWIEVGKTGGNTEGVDIDAYISSGVVPEERYSYVRLIDDQNGGGYPDEGADIDAIGAIESAAPVTTTTADESTATTEPTTSTTTIAPADTTTSVSLSTTTTLRDLGCGPINERDCGIYGGGKNDGWYCEEIDDCSHDPEDLEYMEDHCITKDTPECLIGFLYKSYSGEVKMLRRFRDNVLTQTPEGQEIIRLYYEWSPAIVNAMEDDEVFREEVKKMVDGVLALIGGVE